MVANIHPKPKPVKVPKVKPRHMKRGRKSLRQKLDDQLNEMVKKIVILRDGFCVCPAPENGHSTVMQPGHLITRKKEGIKYDLFNVSCQCKTCNGRHNYFWSYYDTWFIRHFGEQERVRLDEDAEKHIRYTVDEMTELLRQMTEIHSRQLEDKTFKPRFTQKQILSGEWKNGRENKTEKTKDSTETERN